MNKRISTLAALLLASGAGYAVVSTVFTQSGFKPGVNYAIEGIKPAVGVSVSALSVLVDQGGIKVAENSTFADGKVWTVADIDGTTKGLKFGNQYLSQTAEGFKLAGQADALRIVLDATKGNAIKSGEEYLSIKTDATTGKPILILGATPGLYLYEADVNTPLTKTLFDAIGIDKKIAIAQSEITWTAASTYLNAATTITTLTTAVPTAANVWYVTADGKISLTESSVAPDYLTSVNGDASTALTADGAASAATAFTIEEGVLKGVTNYVSFDGGTKYAPDATKGLSLYAVDAEGTVSTTPATSIAAGKYIIAPALTTTTIPANGYVFATEYSETVVSEVMADNEAYAKNNAYWQVVAADVQAKDNDSVYVKAGGNIGYLSSRMNTTTNKPELYTTDAPTSKFKLEDDQVGFKYGGTSYSVKIAASTSATVAGALTIESAAADLVFVEAKAKGNSPLLDVFAYASGGKTETTFNEDSIALGKLDTKDYLYVVVDGKYVSIAADGSIELLDAKPSTLDGSKRATWVPTEKGLQSVYITETQLTEKKTYLSVLATSMKAAATHPFSLTVDAGSEFAWEGGKVKVTTGSDVAYLESEDEGKIIVAKKTPDVVQDVFANMYYKLSLTTEKAKPEVVAGQKLVTKGWSEGEYYLLSDGDGFVKSDGTVTPATADLASDANYLWKVDETANLEKPYSYAFKNMETGKWLTIDQHDGFFSTSPFTYADACGMVLRSDVKFLGGSKKVALGAAGTAKTYGLYEVGNLPYSTEALNNKLGNSFTLGTEEVVEESALVDQPLRAVRIIVGGVEAQYFAVAKTCNITEGVGEEGSALSLTDAATEALLKDASFVVIGDAQYLAEAVSTGKGFAYTTTKGANLFDFANNKAKEGIDKAQFITEYKITKDPITTVNSLIITQKVIFDKTTNLIETVRPQVLTVRVKNAETGVVEDKNAVVTMNTTADIDKWAVINFNGNKGVANNHFDQAYNATAGNVVGGKAGFIYDFKSEDKLVDPAKGYVHLNRPEGQWVIRYYDLDEYEEGFWMFNRESQKRIFLGSTIYTVKDAAGEVVPNKYYLADQHNQAAGDTINLAPVALCHERLGGYGHSLDETDSITFDKVNLATTAYRIGIKNGSFDGIAYIQNSSVHNNQLTVNIKDNDGLRFYLVPADTLAYGLNYSGKKYWEVVGDEAIDSLYRVSYAIQERTTKRFVGFEDGKLELNSDVNAKTADRFFFKETVDGQFVIVLADGVNKIYANIGDASLHAKPIYDRDIADAFILDTIGAPKYADILKNSKGDNDTTLVHINFYSVENKTATSAYMLTAGENQFLVEGVPSVLKAGQEYPAADFNLVVDTAYVKRAGNTMPLYYLGMNGTLRKDSTTMHKNEKDENGHDILCKHPVMNDSIAGKFLFAMYDSIYYAASKTVKAEDHCYHYTNTEHFARLRFVDAVHMRDTMYVQASKVAPKDTLSAGVVTSNIPANKQHDWLSGFSVTPELRKSVREDMGIELANSNFGLFAFEINPANDKEYAIYSPAAERYIAYINGNVVMAPQASYYTMVNSNEGGSVDNENIQTSDFSVIAGHGTVSILNAAGKTVAISNILGQTLVNTVLTSDNATISVPAGIVVVAVEGEEAVKAIVR